MTDYELVTKKLAEVGSELFDSFNNGDNDFEDFEPDIHVDFWNVHGRGLIVVLHDNGYGLYQFVGNDGDSVEKDLEFIQQFSNANKSSSSSISSQQEMIDRQFEFAQKHGE